MNENHTPDLPEGDGIKLLDILQALAENARLLVFGPIIVGLIALGVSFLLNPSYIATTSIMTPQQSQGGAAAALAQLSALAGMAGMGGAGPGLGGSAGMICRQGWPDHYQGGLQNSPAVRRNGKCLCR